MNRGFAFSAHSRKRSLAWCERLQLNEWIHKKVEELSKGMQQKVQFIAALLHDPDLVIIDEPFAGLDPSNAVMLKNVLLELKKDGKTILFSTHRMDQVERLCDAICLIDHGRSILEGAPQMDGNDLVESFNNYGNYVESRLKPGVGAQQLLRRARRPGAHLRAVIGSLPPRVASDIRRGDFASSPCSALGSALGSARIVGRLLVSGFETCSAKCDEICHSRRAV